ncbi:MAG: hypothetical protein KDA83_12075 [Planctomycetales bacterium]|nr:hypothetical protein [Planctomycetales bacterium]
MKSQPQDHHGERAQWSTCWLAGLVIGIVLGSTGCRLPFMTPRAPKAPELLSAQPTAEDIAMTIATQSNRVRQVQSQVRLSVQDMPAVSGQLRFERPRRLRIQAKFLGMVGGPGVDIGSNDEAFWIWMKANLPGAGPAFVYANHDQFAQTLAQQRIPMQPEWIADALGLVTIPADAILEGPFARRDRTWELRYRVDSPSGTLTRVLIVEAVTARVVEQFWYDSNSRLLAHARSSDFEYLDPPGVSMPRRVVLTVSPQTEDQMTLTLQMSGLMVNQATGNDQIWVMPRPEGVPAVDLGRPGAWMTSVPNDVSAMPAPVSTTGYPQHGYRPQYRGATYR